MLRCTFLLRSLTLFNLETATYNSLLVTVEKVLKYYGLANSNELYAFSKKPQLNFKMSHLQFERKLESSKWNLVWAPVFRVHLVPTCLYHFPGNSAHAWSVLLAAGSALSPVSSPPGM